MTAASGSNPNPEEDLSSGSRCRSEKDSGKRPQILIVEDSRADLVLIREAIAATGINAVVHVASDGEQALQFIDAADQNPNAARPDLVLLDLNLPRADGAEVLRQIRSSEACKNARVLIVSSSDSVKDRESVGALGFDGYFRKPSVYAEFLKLGPIVRELLLLPDIGRVE